MMIPTAAAMKDRRLGALPIKYNSHIGRAVLREPTDAS